MFEPILNDADTWVKLLTGAAGAAIYLLIKHVIQKIRNSGHYALKCMYPNCDFKVMVSDEKYAYICDDLMADHQNRKHPLEESNL